MAGDPLPDTGARRRAGKHLLLVSLALAGLGLAMVYSSSAVLADLRHDDSGFFLVKQTLRALLAVLVMLVAARVPFSLWQRGSRFLLALSGVLLALVLVVGVGRSNMFLPLPFGLSFQPSEAAKLALVVFLAQALVGKQERIRDFWSGLLPLLLVVGLTAGLIALEPDLGGAVVVGLLGVTMLWVGGARTRHLLGLGVVGLLGAGLSMAVMTHQRVRVEEWLAGGSYQVKQGLIAMGSGGWWGVGLNNSVQKYQYLPEVHTDFVFALVGEELGLLGSLSVVAIFVGLAISALRLARQAPSPQARYVAVGIVAMIVTNALVNTFVATNLLPTTGLPLPFISYGGSSLLANFAGIGILLGIARSRALPAPPTGTATAYHVRPMAWGGR